MKNNEITAEIYIRILGGKKRIINSFENIKRENPHLKWENIETKENEKDIKDCEIYINGKKIDFTYDYNFEDEGKYKIRYIFKKMLNSTNFMFYDCISLLSLDLSNFNTKNVTNMHSMFHNCKSLLSLDLSNFNTNYYGKYVL